MEFKLNEDQQMIHDLAKDFAESVLQPRIDEIEAGEMTEVSNGEKHPQLPHDIHQQLAECGFIGISFPEEYNGLGMGHVEQAIVIKELSRISPSVGKCLDVYILGLEALDLYASPEQKEKYLAPCCSGEQTVSFAFTEPDTGSDPKMLKTRLEKQADGSYKNATTTIPAALGVMTAFNRVGATWTGGSYALITGILRTEWGFNGAVITDNANTGVFMGGQQMIEAGGDMKLTYEKNSARWDDFDKDNAETYHYAREALHHVLYTTANTKAMNGAMPGSIYKDGPQVSTIVRTVVNILCTLLLILLAYRVFRVWKPSKRKLAKMEAKAAKKAAKKANT